MMRVEVKDGHWRVNTLPSASVQAVLQHRSVGAELLSYFHHQLWKKIRSLIQSADCY